eukprot:TRINITY_DN52919_c0_g1_i1.p1 TRINITY_DN52919_c0_g1~~TRINITY_DN52919_c0_g1_i1.p1  ORF type:complete len:373 (+),score=94.34 TRINITY_DN52919_c0_g1_i1:97-1119(+)
MLPTPPPTSQVQRFSAVGGSAAEVLSPPPVSSSTVSCMSPDTYGMDSGSKTVRGHMSGVDQFMEPAARPQTSGGAGLLREESSCSIPVKEDFLLTLPSNIQASLRTFEELQMQKSHLMSSSSRLPTSRSNSHTTPPISHIGRSNSTGRMPHGGHLPGAVQTRGEKEAQKKLQVAESVMRKLHKKNQKLAKEAADLRAELDRRGQAGGGSAVGTAAGTPGSSNADVDAMRGRIKTLEEQLRNQSRRADPGDAVRGAISGQPSQSLADQYQELLDSNIASVTDITSTSKINKEVKAFFVALRKKIHADMLSHELDRIVWNEKMADLEEQMCERYVQQRTSAA